MPQLRNGFPRIFEHPWAVLCHDGIFREIFAPENQPEKGDAGICARVELRERIVSIKQINSVLGVLFAGSGEVCVF